MAPFDNLSPWPPGDEPECPVCGAPAVSKSTSTRTLVSGASGYSDDGEYHKHDPNWTSADLTCENGHEWERKTRRSCPAPDCDFGGETKVSVTEGETDE